MQVYQYLLQDSGLAHDTLSKENLYHTKYRSSVSRYCRSIIRSVFLGHRLLLGTLYLSWIFRKILCVYRKDLEKERGMENGRDTA